MMTTAALTGKARRQRKEDSPVARPVRYGFESTTMG